MLAWRKVGHARIGPKSGLVTGIWKNCEGSHFVELAYTWVHIPSAAGSFGVGDTLHLAVGLMSVTLY